MRGFDAGSDSCSDQLYLSLGILVIVFLSFYKKPLSVHGSNPSGIVQEVHSPNMAMSGIKKKEIKHKIHKIKHT